MFLLTKRQTRASLAAATGAAVYLAASEIGKDKLKLTGLFVLASASMAGMVTTKASSKAYSAHHRIDQLVPVVAGKYDKTGGTVSGSVTVTGDHTIQGSLFGTGGTVSVGDAMHVVTNDFTADGRITAHGNCGVDGNITGGTIGVPGGTRANLGAGATLAQCQARIDYILGTLLVSANISY
jgi:hypothetical protein